MAKKIEPMKTEIVWGDLLDQDVEVIVNSWNRNIIPWWLLLPQGVSGAIKRRGGNAPFQEVARFGPIPLGQARETSSGKLKFKSIIHVAGINMCWFATAYSVKTSVHSAMEIVNNREYSSVAFPLIGAGSGNRAQDWSLNIMLESFSSIDSPAEVKIVRFAK